MGKLCWDRGTPEIPGRYWVFGERFDRLSFADYSAGGPFADGHEVEHLGPLSSAVFRRAAELIDASWRPWTWDEFLKNTPHDVDIFDALAQALSESGLPLGDEWGGVSFAHRYLLQEVMARKRAPLNSKRVVVSGWERQPDRLKSEVVELLNDAADLLDRGVGSHSVKPDGKADGLTPTWALVDGHGGGVGEI